MKALSILQPNDIALFESMRGNYASQCVVPYNI